VEVVAQDVEVISKAKMLSQENEDNDEDLGPTHPLQRIINFVMKAKRVRQDIVERMCQKYGVNIADVIDVLEVEGDYILGKFRGDGHDG
jgi:energy-converting hydrogenase A subunit M